MRPPQRHRENRKWIRLGHYDQRRVAEVLIYQAGRPHNLNVLNEIKTCSEGSHFRPLFSRQMRGGWLVEEIDLARLLTNDPQPDSHWFKPGGRTCEPPPAGALPF